MFHEINAWSVVVQLTIEDRDTFRFDIKELNWDSYMERCVKGVRQYIVNGDCSALPQARERYEMQVYKQQTTSPWLNTADTNKDQICTTCSVTYWYSHIIQAHCFIHPVPLLTLWKYFNMCVCVKLCQSPASISVTLTVQHGQHSIYCSVSHQFNSHLFWFYVSF